jgi:hypothetical protein
VTGSGLGRLPKPALRLDVVTGALQLTVMVAVWAVVATSVAATIRLFGGKRTGFLILGLVCGSVLIVLS